MRSSAPQLLNDDGTASMATALMMSHHGFRRDIALFARALHRAAVDPDKVPALREEWKSYCHTLHEHHGAEDQRMFPFMKAQHPELAAIIDGLTAEHRQIDPLLEAGEGAFARLPATGAAAALVGELAALLDAHLATEEAHVVPLLRGAKEFPPPDSDAELDFFAQGFAWASHGVAPEVLQALHAMLPAPLTTRLPAASAAYAQRCQRVWGTAETGASRTSVPDWLAG